MHIMQLCVLALHALGVAANDDCDEAYTCATCPAGCTWIDRWDSTGWHCIENSQVVENWRVENWR